MPETHRPLLGFMIVGVQKGGTSALAAFLYQHPQLCTSVPKEVHRFDAPDYAPDRTPARIDDRYRPCFAHCDDGAAVAVDDGLLSERAIRVNVTLPSRILALMDRVAGPRGRSGLLTSAVVVAEIDALDRERLRFRVGLRRSDDGSGRRLGGRLDLDDDGRGDDRDRHETAVVLVVVWGDVPRLEAVRRRGNDG